MTAVRVDLSALLDAIVSQNEAAVTSEIAEILSEDITPSVLAGRLTIPAALGDQSGEAVTALVAAGHLGDWIRIIPPGPEPGAERRQKVLPAVPLVEGALFAGRAIAAGLKLNEPQLPEPLFPRDIQHKEGAWGLLRDAIRDRDPQSAGRVLMGFYGTGTDYRELEGAIYSAACSRFSADGAPLLDAMTAFQALDYVDWGNRVPMLLHWLLPRLKEGQAEPAGTQDVRAYLAQPEHDLDFVRKRLQMKNYEAANASLRQTIARGSTQQVLDGVMAALRSGATGDLVGMQICLAAAEFLAGIPTEMNDVLDAAVMALRVANAARIAVTQVQDIRVLPIVFYAANLVSRTIQSAKITPVVPKPSPSSVPLVGGFIESNVLRNLGRFLDAREEAGARSTVRRYIQMQFPARSLVGTIGLNAASVAIASDRRGRGIGAVQAAGEAFLAMTPAMQSSDGILLIDAAIHVTSAQPADIALAQRIEQGIGVQQ
jgi:hypothetical protein